MCKALKSMGDAIILITILAENHAKNYSTIFKRTLQKIRVKIHRQKNFQVFIHHSCYLACNTCHHKIKRKLPYLTVHKYNFKGMTGLCNS